MGRLKKDHGGYRTSGIWLKYQSPKVNELPIKAKSKKDTRKWCRGKVGVEHDLFRHYYHHWDYISRTFIQMECKRCGREFYRAKDDSSIPLKIPVDFHESDTDGQVQVKVNGIPLPFKYNSDEEWCKSCGRYHERY